MLGLQISKALPPQTDRNAYVVWMALIWAAILGGFGLDFMRYMHETPPPPGILHFHAAVYVIWLVLVSMQIFLVQSGNIRFHMRLGWATAIVSAAMVPLGLFAALVDQARQVDHPDYAPQFLALEFEEVLAFSTFIIAGLLSRKSLAEHKRVMRPVVLGAALLWGGEVAATILNFNPAWKASMVALVRMWGYTG